MNRNSRKSPPDFDPSKPIYMTLTGSLIPILNPEQLEALRELEMPLIPRIPLTMHSAMRH
ncbi:hypothetical protein [Aquibium oceanicum]|uniref:Uncharacterized protein n=1 Tax=Aquibium oceanicum TaxID=1670800 RepID=A0A1L3SP68_9HYPH|nr:hypothetical protein [Aquibium oceanicum]APH71135.1 hypothetical protein BSQ44_06945 [Aquibium oceanicum]